MAESAPTVVDVFDNVLPDGPSTFLASGQRQINDPTPTFKVSLSGTNAAAGDRVQIGLSDLHTSGAQRIYGAATLTAQDVANGYALVTAEPPAGSFQRNYARLVHADGTSAGWSTDFFDLRIDLRAPSAPKVFAAFDNDGGVLEQIPVGGRTDDFTPAFAYSADDEIVLGPPGVSPGHDPHPGSAGRPQLLVDGQVTPSELIGGRLTPVQPLAPGPHTVQMRIIDPAGNVGMVSKPFTLTVEAVRPPQGSSPVFSGADGGALPALAVSELDLSKAVLGSIKVAAADGLQILRVGDYTIVDDGGFHPGSWASPNGLFTVELTSWDPGTGRLDFAVRAHEALYHYGSSNVLALGLGFTAYDVQGDVSQAVVPLNVQDAAPATRWDTDVVAPGGVANGNVISDSGFGDDGDADNGADFLGPDGAIATTVARANPGGGALYVRLSDNVDFKGLYGDLTIGPNGFYSYRAFADAPDGAQEVFTYWIQDPDNDQAEGRLTITIDAPGGGDTSTGGSGQALTSPTPGSSLAGGAGDDTLTASAGLDTLTGGAGSDVFSLSVEPWAPIHVTDFLVGTDRLDLSKLLAAANYDGSDPIADRYVFLESDGAGGTIVRFDRDGPGGDPQWPNTIVDLEHVAPASLSWSQLAGGGDTSSGTGGQALTSPQPGSSLSGGAGPDTLTASAGLDTLTGGDGGDVFRLSSEPWAPIHITDFTLGADKLDLTSLFQAASYTGTDPVADRYIYFESDGADGTIVRFDRDGAGGDPQWPNTVIDLEHVAPAGLTWEKLAGGGGSASGQALVSTGPGSSLAGGAGADTLTASQGLDTLSGGGGGDVFVLSSEPWAPIHISDFKPGEDRLDLSALFEAAHYAGVDPIADGYVYIESDGADGSLLRFDRDAAGPSPAWPNTIIDLHGVAPAQVSAGDWIIS